jgi:hypothetical protein
MVLAYALTKFLKVNQFEIPFFLKNYFTDLLCMPITLTISLVLLQVIKRDDRLRLTPIMIISLTIFYAYLFEYYAPSTSSNFTADWLDVLMYCIGSLFFWFWQKYHPSLKLIGMV